MPERPFSLDFKNYGETPPPEVSPNAGEIWGAAFEMNNDVLNAYQYLTRPGFKANPTFDLVGKLKASKYWDTGYRENFLGVKSEEEFNSVASRVDNEDKNRDIYLRAGWAGTAAGITAGVLSPTIFLPLSAGGRGIYAFGKAALLGGAAAALQEVPLQANQVTRTAAEGAVNVGFGTVLGGILGGAVAHLAPGEAKAIEAGMADNPGLRAIPRSVGSAEVNIDPGAIAGKATKGMVTVLDSNAVTRSPVTVALNQSDFVSGRTTMAQLDDAGLVLEGNALHIPTSEGGTVANNVGVKYGRVADYAEVADNIYNDYVFDGAVPKFAPNIRATLRGFRNAEKLSKSEFRKQVFLALADGDTHENQFVAKVAKAAREKVFDPILKDMQSVNMLGMELPPSADLTYVSWVFNHEAIGRRPNEFIDFLAERYNIKLNEQFNALWEKHQLKQARDEEFLTDIQRTQKEIDQLRDILGDQLKGVEARMNEQQHTALEDTIAGLRAMARPLKEGGLQDDLVRRQMLADARDMEAQAGPLFQANKLERREIKRRLSNLNKATVVVEERLANKLDKIDRAETLSESGLMRVARKGQKILNEVENWTEARRHEELTKLRDEFERVAGIYDRQEERLAKLAEGEPILEPVYTTKGFVAEKVGEQAPLPADEAMLRAEAQQQGRAETMTHVTERIADWEDLGLDAFRSLLTDMLDETITRVRKINDRRAIRTQKMREKVPTLTPEAQAARIAKIEAKGAQRSVDLNERVRVMGGELDDKLGKADFTKYATDAARKTKDKILGTMLRLPVVDMMQAEKGAALPRLLGFIPTHEMAPWLDTDIESVIRHHVRTMVPDIEIAKKFKGDVQMQEEWTKFNDELNDRLAAIKTTSAFDKKGDPILVDGNPRLKFDTPAKQEKEALRLRDKFAEVKLGLETTVKRLRHTHGLPKNPDGMGYRMARVAMDLNVLRYMGGVVLASVADPARPVARYGLLSTFRDGFLPMVTNLRAMKLSKREAMLMGVGIEASSGTRAHAMMDIMDDNLRGSKFERAVQYASGKQGVVALFSQWTDKMKLITFGVANARMMDSIAEFNTSAKPAVATIEFLAQNGISPQLAERIWKEVQTNAGGAKVDGVWLPNTESWKDGGAVDAFRAAVHREVNNTITTPGLERPEWMTGTTVGRMVGQFRSFGFSATYKTLGAGLQQRDANFIQGVTSALALGAVSYYLYAKARGGKVEQDMMNASWERWADEAYQRAGLTGAFGLGQDIASRIPMFAPFASLSGGRTTRRGGDDLLDALGGPTFDLINKGAQVLTGMHDPTAATVHAGRLMSLYQNVTLLSRGYDAIEASVNRLLGTEKKQ